MTKFTTRIAPSPTGYFHIGSARTAYFNYLAAKASGGKFILRIDDTDLTRNNAEYVSHIYKSMDWLGLDYDSTFRQSDNLEQYLNISNMLVQNKLAYREGSAVILDVQKNNLMPDSFTDNIGGVIKVSKQDIDNSKTLVLIKSDNMPTYHFASVVDDYKSNVNNVIRGVDHISNTVKQISMINAINLCGESVAVPQYSHIGLLCIQNKKISKRAGQLEADLAYYIDKRYSSEAMLNWVLRMGWGPYVDDKTNSIIDKDKAISMFLSGGKMKSSNANIDLVKLDWFNRKYVPPPNPHNGMK